MKSGKKELLLFSAVSVAVTFLYFRHFLGNFFIYDDFKYFDNVLRGFPAVIHGYGNVEMRVVSNIVWWPLYSIFGLNPVPYNVFGLILHCANAVLLYLFICRLFGRAYGTVAGMVFLTASAACDAVLWKATSSTLICFFFYLAALHLYTIYRQGGPKRYMALSVIAFLFAMFSKEDAASMPLVVLLLEMAFMDGWAYKKAVLWRVSPYAAIILIYVLINAAVFKYLLHVQPQLEKSFSIRPLYSLFAGFTVFFLDPNGSLNLASPAVYITGLGIILSFFWVKDKRKLLFCYGWIFIAFLPQSFTRLGQLVPKETMNAISRYLYIASAGSAAAFAVVLVRFMERFSVKAFYLTSAVFFTIFVFVNYGQVQTRGMEWQKAEIMKTFLVSLKKALPDFPPNSYITVIRGPGSGFFLQEAVRSFYRRTDITYIFDERSFTPTFNSSLFVISCNWGAMDYKDVGLEIYRLP